MPRTKFSEYSAVASENTDIDGINIGEGMAPSDVNNSQRAFLSQVREFIDGTSGDTLTSAKIVATTATILSGVSVTGTATFNSAVVLSSSVTGSALSLSGALTVGGAAILSSTLGVTGTASMGVIDATTIEVTNVKAKDGTAAITIADSTGVATIASAVLTTADINGGTADNVVIGGGTAAAGTFTTATATTGNITTVNATAVNATTVDATNVEVTNVKAKDGTAALTIADSTGVVTIPSAVLTTADINGGTVDNAAVGAGTPSTGAFTTLSSNSTTTLNGTTIPASKTLLVSTDIGTTVQGYDADTAKYDDTTANFSGTLQNGGSNVLVDSDIGSTVLAYDSNLQGFVTAFTLPTTDGSANQVLKTDGSGNIGFTTVAGTGTVTSVDVSGGTTGLTTSGGPVTTSGTITLAGVLAATNGGTGLTTPGAAGNILTSDGTNWTSAVPAAGGIDYVVKTANYTTQNNEGVLANTSGGSFTVTLPATPSTGDQVVVADPTGDWGTNNLTIGRNGYTIEGASEDLVCDINDVSVQLIYDGTTWQVYSQVGGAGGDSGISTGKAIAMAIVFG